ncbi:MAG: DUF3256 family protein [Bacteroidaceae bacterium]|nr:DUF3256 family protein [Bacteroidaceae bacterium]
MKRIILILIFSFSHFLTFAQPMSEVFTVMPDSILPLLTQKNRRDMVDFYNNYMEAKVRNRLNDYVQLDTLTPDYLRLRLSTVSMAEMKLLQTEDSLQVICLIQSITSPVRDSRITFYDKNWQRLNWVEMPKPETADFFSPAPDSVATDLTFAQRSIDDLRFVEVKADPCEPVFILTLTDSELNIDEKKLARRFLRSLRYRWTGSGFVKEGN